MKAFLFFVAVAFLWPTVADARFFKQRDWAGDLFKKRPKDPEDDWKPESILTEMMEAKSTAVSEPVEELMLNLTPEEMELSFMQMLGNGRAMANTTKTSSATKKRKTNDGSEGSRAKACLICGMRAFDPSTCTAGACGKRFCWHAAPNPGRGTRKLPKGSAASNEGFTNCIEK